MNLIKYVKVVEINLTELCNLKCNFCPRSTFYPNKNLHMSVETANVIIRHLKEISYEGNISIAGRGEPTLARNFAEISELFIAEGFTLTCSTNGKNVEKYIDVLSRYNIVAYDVYDADRTIFEKIKSKYMKYDNFIFKHIPSGADWSVTRNFTNRAGAFEFGGLPEDKSCDRPIHKMFIDYNGDYKLCCEDWKEKVTLGNVYQESIKSYITNNKMLNEYREELLFGERSRTPCDKCSYKRKNLNDIEMINASHSHFDLPINNLLAVDK